MKTKTDNHIDTALRSVMERRAERIPALSDDFAQQVMSKMNARKESAKPKRLHSSFIIRHSSFPYWVGIAAALLIAFILWSESHKEATTQPEVKPIVAKAGPQSVPQPIVKEKKEEVLAEVQPTPQPVRKQRKAVKKQSAPTEEPMLAQVESMIPAEATSQPQVHNQSFQEARVNSMNVGNDVVDPKMLLYTAEIELEKNTHQRQEAHEKEMQQRGLEILLYLLTDKEDELANGTVNTQKS